MRVLAAVLCVAACACAAGVRGARGYHADVGIPLAASLRAAEEKMRAEEVDYGQGRIINGRPALPNAHPFFGGLSIDLHGHIDGSVCGSTLVSANRLVTAAHCWWDGTNLAWQFTVILGTTRLDGGLRIPTQHVVMHPQWQTSNLQNDIAMIYLPFNVPLSDSIRPVALPSSFEMQENFAGQRANAVGYGITRDGQLTASTILNHVDLTVISMEHCRALVPSWSGFLFPSTLCTSGAGNVGVCRGDSGGPLTVERNGRRILIGVASFAAQHACEQGLPSGFARVNSFLSFINQHLSWW